MRHFRVLTSGATFALMLTILGACAAPVAQERRVLLEDVQTPTKTAGDQVGAEPMGGGTAAGLIVDGAAATIPLPGMVAFSLPQALPAPTRDQCSILAFFLPSLGEAAQADVAKDIEDCRSAYPDLFRG